MATRLSVHPTHPQMRLVNQVVAGLRRGQVIVYPTDSCYALGCALGEKAAHDRICRIRRLDKHHNFTLVCKDLTEIGVYAKVDNTVFRLLRHATPGPYTFILPATREVPRRLLNQQRRTIGVRVPAHAVATSLLDALGEPLMSVSLIPPGETLPLSDPDVIEADFGHEVDWILDAGAGGVEASTVLDLSEVEPRVLRVGNGDLDRLGITP